MAVFFPFDASSNDNNTAILPRNAKYMQQFKLNISHIKNIQFVDAYIILSISIIWYQYEIGVLYTKVLCATA